MAGPGDDRNHAGGLTTEEFLEHFGVKGMHWGRRKAEPHADAATAGSLRKRAKQGGGIHTLSNKELRTAIERRQLETQYTKAHAGVSRSKQIQQLQRGAKMVSKLMPTIGSLIAVGFAAKAYQNSPIKVDSYLHPGGPMFRGAARAISGR